MVTYMCVKVTFINHVVVFFCSRKKTALKVANLATFGIYKSSIYHFFPKYFVCMVICPVRVTYNHVVVFFSQEKKQVSYDPCSYDPYGSYDRTICTVRTIHEAIFSSYGPYDP